MWRWIATYMAATIAPPTMKNSVVFTCRDSYLLQREREGGKDRQTDRERERERQMDRERERQTDGQGGRERERQTDGQGGREREREIGRVGRDHSKAEMSHRILRPCYLHVGS